MNRLFAATALLMALALASILPGCKKGVTNPDDGVLSGDYFPLSVGRVFSFSYLVPTAVGFTAADTIPAIQTWTITGTAVLPPGGTNAFVVSRVYNWGYRDRFFIAKTSSFVATYNDSSDLYPYVIMPLPARDGQMYVSAHVDTAQIVGVEDVSTLAGNFKSCIKVKVSLASGAASSLRPPGSPAEERQIISWYAPGVGKVKWLYVPESWYELDSYHY